MRLLEDAQHDFVMNNGTIVRNVAELSFALKNSDDSVFFHHVNEVRNDFADWIGNSVGDDSLKNEMYDVSDKGQMIRLLDSRLFSLAAAEAVSEEMPPDIPPQVEDEKAGAVQAGAVKNIEQESKSRPTEPVKLSKTITEPEQQPIQNYAAPDKNESWKDAKESKMDQAQEEELNDKKANKEQNGNVVEIREITLKKLQQKDIDRLFKKGVPSICNMIFAGTMSTGKTEMAIKIALGNKSSVYISLQDSVEKIINAFYAIDQGALDKINSGIVTIKQLDTFEMARTQDIEPFTFIKEHAPDIVVVDSLSSLRLSFGDNEIGYRNFVNSIFKYFESLGIVAIFIKELDTGGDINKEFYENILADIIVSFNKGKMGHMSVYKYFKSR